MSHVLNSKQFTITQLVRWKNPVHPLSNCGLIHANWGTKQTDNLINQMIDDLKDSDIIPYIRKSYENDEILQHPVSNVIMPNNYTFGDTLTWTLIFASHPEVVHWCSNNDKFEIIDIPNGVKINVLDRRYGLAFEDMYEYIMILENNKVYHF